MSLNPSQPIRNHPPEQMVCLCLPFATFAHWARSCLSDIAEFFRNLFCSTRRLEPSRVTPPPESITSTESQPIISPAQQTSSFVTEIKPLSGQRCLSSHLIDFYQGAINDRGITLAFLLEQADDIFLEGYHFWVQWVFPQQTPSGSNPTAPILDQETINRFRDDPHLQAQLLKMFKKTLCFFGLKLQEEMGTIIKGDNFDQRAPKSWFTSSNHNHLRITRILDCMQLLQDPASPSLSIAFFRFLKQIQQQHKIVSPDNFSHWQKFHPTL